MAATATPTLGRNSQLLVLCLLIIVALLQLMIMPWRRTEASNRVLGSNGDQGLHTTFEGAGFGHEMADPLRRSKGDGYASKRGSERFESSMQEKKEIGGNSNDD